MELACPTGGFVHDQCINGQCVRTSKCPDKICPAVTCSISDCPKGCEVDSQGCVTGKCKSDLKICPAIACAINECVLDSSGCWTHIPKACAAPVCDGSKLVDTGNIDANGCKIYACEGQTCSAPVCKNGEKPYFTGGYDNYGCKLMKCAQEELYCCGDFDERTGKTKNFWSDDKNCGIPIGVACAGSCPSVVDRGLCETDCSMPICKDGSKPFDTGKIDNNGCNVYSCPTNKCPEGCKCSGDTITCPNIQNKPVEVEISTSRGTSSISVEKVSENSISIKEGTVSVRTQKKIVIEEKKLLMQTSKGNKEVKIMPSTASETAINQLKLKNYTIELKDVGKPVYEITGKKDVKIIGFIKAEMSIKSQISAETGTIEKTEKPWWSFLAKE